jgi:hypothetical protein
MEFKPGDQVVYIGEINSNWPGIRLRKGVVMHTELAPLLVTNYIYTRLYGFIPKVDVIKLDGLTNIEKIVYDI